MVDEAFHDTTSWRKHSETKVWTQRTARNIKHTFRPSILGARPQPCGWPPLAWDSARRSDHGPRLSGEQTVHRRLQRGVEYQKAAVSDACSKTVVMVGAMKKERMDTSRLLSLPSLATQSRWMWTSRTPPPLARNPTSNHPLSHVRHAHERKQGRPREADLSAGC